MADLYQSLKKKSRPIGPAPYDDKSYKISDSGVITPQDRFAAKPFTGSEGAAVMQGFQFTWSQGNPWPPSRGHVGQIGGPFRSVKHWYSTTPFGKPAELKELLPRITVWSPGYRVYTQYRPIPFSQYYGWSPNQVVSLANPLGDAALFAKGTKAIELVKPDRTVNSLLTSLIELKRDGIPDVPTAQFAELWRSFRKSRRKIDTSSPKVLVKEFHEFLKTLGQEHLNVVFGWLPLASDTQKLLATFNKLPEIWAQYERDAGRRVRRHYSFPTERTTSVTNMGAPVGPAQSTYSYASKGSYTYTEEKTVDVWFDGAFRYYLPDKKDDSPLAELYRFAAYANKCYGLAPTPDNIWNVIPWTWLLDWGSNLGSVVSNLSSTLTNGLVLEYGYVCQRTRIVRRYAADLTFRGPSGPFPVSKELCWNVQVLSRVPATPYGFGLDWGAFSAQQLAILASIGINRR